MPSRNTGNESTALIQKLRIMSLSSWFSSSEPATIFCGSSVTPQMGQLPGLSCSRSFSSNGSGRYGGSIFRCRNGR